MRSDLPFGPFSYPHMAAKRPSRERNYDGKTGILTFYVYFCPTLRSYGSTMTRPAKR